MATYRRRVILKPIHLWEATAAPEPRHVPLPRSTSSTTHHGALIQKLGFNRATRTAGNRSARSRTGVETVFNEIRDFPAFLALSTPRKSIYGSDARDDPRAPPR